MKKVLQDGTSVNSCSGEFGELQLPQGDMMLLENLFHSEFDVFRVRASKALIPTQQPDLSEKILPNWTRKVSLDKSIG